MHSRERRFQHVHRQAKLFLFNVRHYVSSRLTSLERGSLLSYIKVTFYPMMYYVEMDR